MTVPLLDRIICDWPFLHPVADVINTLSASTVTAMACTRYHGQVFPFAALRGVQSFFGESTIIFIVMCFLPIFYSIPLTLSFLHSETPCLLGQ
jgi:hypothetical protein